MLSFHFYQEPTQFLFYTHFFAQFIFCSSKIEIKIDVSVIYIYFSLQQQQQQQPTQQFIVQSPGPNKTILNQNVVFINQSGQQQIITSNQQQQGNNVGECEYNIFLHWRLDSRFSNIYFKSTKKINFFPALNQQQQRIMTSQQSMVNVIFHSLFLFFFWRVVMVTIIVFVPFLHSKSKVNKF